MYTHRYTYVYICLHICLREHTCTRLAIAMFSSPQLSCISETKLGQTIIFRSYFGSSLSLFLKSIPFPASISSSTIIFSDAELSRRCRRRRYAQRRHRDAIIDPPGANEPLYFTTSYGPISMAYGRHDSPPRRASDGL